MQLKARRILKLEAYFIAAEKYVAEKNAVKDVNNLMMKDNA